MLLKLAFNKKHEANESTMMVVKSQSIEGSGFPCIKGNQPWCPFISTFQINLFNASTHQSHF